MVAGFRMVSRLRMAKEGGGGGGGRWVGGGKGSVEVLV